MKIVNFGSLNIDHVYDVNHFVRPGETLASEDYVQFAGGKGLNQSIALARAGATVLHAGKIGPEGEWLKEKLTSAGVDTSLVMKGLEPTGHAIIQVTPEGQNAIIVEGGANQCIRDEEIDKVLRALSNRDVLLLQNEINSIGKIIPLAKEKGARVVFNPAPITKAVKSFPLELVDILIVNEIEGAALATQESAQTILNRLVEKYPNTVIALTLSEKGVLFADKEQIIEVPAPKVDVLDTTAAGDTFVGFFISSLSSGAPIKDALTLACQAASLSVTRKGAAESIPTLSELV